MQVHRISMQAYRHIVWTAENVSGYKELHVAERGSRLATVTDVAWLSEDYLLAAHHAARRVSLFNVFSQQEPILTVEIPFRVDTLAVRQPQDDLIEILLSGTWKSHYALACLSRNISAGEVRLNYCGSCMQPLRQPPSFSHGVFYVRDEPGVCYNAGESPRIDLGHGEKIVRLPDGWFPTNACWSSSENVIYIVANGHQPQPHKFQGANASVWKYSLELGSLVQLAELGAAHLDSCVLSDHYLWMNDQYGDRVLGMSQADPNNFVSLEAAEISFPHGIALSPSGKLAVANYKTSSIAIFNLPEIL